MTGGGEQAAPSARRRLGPGPRRDPGPAPVCVLQTHDVQPVKLREQHDQQLSLAFGDLVQHNGPPRPFVTIGELVIQILTERPWPYPHSDATAIKPGIASIIGVEGPGGSLSSGGHRK